MRLSTECREIVNLNYSGLKIRDYQNSDYQKLCFFLLKTCFELGNPKPPTTHELIRWTVTLGQEYKDFSLAEINKAIKLSLVNKLYVFEKEYKKVDISNFHFKPFILLCEILSGYREYRKEKMKYHNKLVREKLSEIESRELEKQNQIQFDKECKDYILKSFNEYKLNNKFEFVDEHLIYFKRLYSSEYFCLTKSEIDKIVFEVKNNLVVEKPKDIYNNELPFSTFQKIKGSKKENLERAKISELSTKKLFDKWIKKQLNINEVIKSLNF